MDRRTPIQTVNKMSLGAALDSSLRNALMIALLLFRSRHVPRTIRINSCFVATLGRNRELFKEFEIDSRWLVAGVPESAASRRAQAEPELRAALKERSARRPEVTTFQPAKDRPNRRHGASSQRTTLVVSSCLSRPPGAPVGSAPEVAAQVSGPGQNFHSAPA